jgi:hypothetical protein
MTIKSPLATAPGNGLCCLMLEFAGVGILIRRSWRKPMRLHVLVLGSLVLAGGCATPITYSSDSEANYSYVFSTVDAPKPTIVQSHVERLHRSVLGIFPLAAEYNGNWEFEMLASSAWLGKVKTGFTEVPFGSVQTRQVPDWFLPSAENYTARKMQTTSYPNAHLFIEKNPGSQEKGRVFIRRH